MDSIDVDPDMHSKGEINLSNINSITLWRNYACAQCFVLNTPHPLHFLPNFIIFQFHLTNQRTPITQQTTAGDDKSYGMLPP